MHINKCGNNNTIGSENTIKVFIIVITCAFLVYAPTTLSLLDPKPNLAFGQGYATEVDEPFKLLDISSPIPSIRDMILTDEINAIGTDIDAIKNASQVGDFETVYNKTIDVVSGPNWGNISADLLVRKELVPLNNFVSNLQFLNTLTKNTTQHTKTINDTIIKKSNALATNYGKVLDALALPMFDIPKIVTNLVLPTVIVVIIIITIPRLRRKYKIKY